MAKCSNGIIIGICRIHLSLYILSPQQMHSDLYQLTCIFLPKTSMGIAPHSSRYATKINISEHQDYSFIFIFLIPLCVQVCSTFPVVSPAPQWAQFAMKTDRRSGKNVTLSNQRNPACPPSLLVATFPLNIQYVVLRDKLIRPTNQNILQKSRSILFPRDLDLAGISFTDHQWIEITVMILKVL